MITKVTAALGIAALAVTALMWAGLRDTAAPEPVVAEAAAVIEPSMAPYRGLAIQVASGHYQPREQYEPLLEEIAELGANSVLLCVPGYMEHARSQSIYLDLRKILPPEDFKAVVRRGRELGLKVIIMPIVLLKNPRGSEWRGVIDPPDWDDWWQQYEGFVLFFADIAREGGADSLIVGSELVSTEKYTAKWRKLIDQVRPRFYGGKLGYSANWDHYRPVEFWEKLDFIGMTSYYTLADKKNPTVEEIVDYWGPIKKDILAWQQRIGKPILMTEVGWCSQEGAAKAPWNYYQNQHATPAGLEEQRRLYEAFIRVWNDTPALMGAIWWEWDASPGGPSDYGYSPRNKPAEQVLRQWFAAGRTSNTTAPAENTDSPTKSRGHRDR
ncbi:MAG: hypothetical protein KAY37_05535 [Phycisphaerae bacterium]|nr:hypothetical protein [Phycisphaerae bacterium]